MTAGNGFTDTVLRIMKSEAIYANHHMGGGEGMKRLGLITCCLVTLALISASPVGAQDVTNKWGFGARLSYYDIGDDTVDGVNVKPDATALYGLNLNYFFIRNFALELSVEYAKSTLDIAQGPTEIEFGDVKQVPVLLTAQYRIPTDFRTDFYLGGGVGYYFNSFDLADIYRSAFPGSDVGVDNSWGFHLNGGLEYFMTDQWAFGVDLKYIWNSADFKIREPGNPETTRKIDLDGFVGGIGIKYYF